MILKKFIMRNQNIYLQNEFINSSYDKIKNEICLFKFSNLKSTKSVTLSQYNYFNYNFIPSEQKKKAENNLSNPSNKIYRNNKYIKKVNIDIPSTKFLLKEEFKNDFLKNYDDSFAKFCGLSKDIVLKIYNNKNTPSFDEFGNININNKIILDILKIYSDSEKIKITRRQYKNRIKKKIKIKEANSSPNKLKNKFENKQKFKAKESNKTELKKIKNYIK